MDWATGPFQENPSSHGANGDGGAAPPVHHTQPLAPLIPGLAYPSEAGRGDRPAGITTALTGPHLRGGTPRASGPLARAEADPRLGAWIRRAVLALVVGGLFTAVADIWAGIAVAAVAVSTDTFFCARVSAVVPATIRVSSAQRRTKLRLARLVPAGYLSVHTRAIPGSDSILDHLVIAPAGLFALDSQRWDRRLPVRATKGHLFHGPFDQTGRLDHARWEAERAGQLISQALGQPVAVRPVMVIHGPTIPWTVMRIRNVDVLGGRRLGWYLRRETSANRLWRLDERQAALIQNVAGQVLPPARGHTHPGLATPRSGHPLFPAGVGVYAATTASLSPAGPTAFPDGPVLADQYLLLGDVLLDQEPPVTDVPAQTGAADTDLAADAEGAEPRATPIPGPFRGTGDDPGQGGGPPTGERPEGR